MKKIIICIMTITLVVSACSTSDLEDYKNAALETEKADQGEMELRLPMDITFDEEGSTFEERRDLSYYETIDLSVKAQFDDSDQGLKVKADTYYNFGGLGFDTTMFMRGNETIIKLPMIDKYFLVEGNTLEVVDNEKMAAQGELMKRLIEEWNAVLQDEDVFSGKKDYVMTDKGQIKTSTYTITINDDQFEVLKEGVMQVVEEENALEAFMDNSFSIGGDEMDSGHVLEYLKSILDDITLVSFEGQAFVDFDGRLVRQIMVVDLINEETTKGDVKTIHLEYEINYDHLGEKQDIDFPEIAPEDLLDVDEIENMEEYFTF